MFFPYTIFIADAVVWWLLPQIHERIGISFLTELIFMSAFGLFVFALAEYSELCLGIDKGKEVSE